VLPAAARLRRRSDFAEVVRRGRRTARGPLVLHYSPPPPAGALGGDAGVPARAGFVVGKVVGPAVVRNRVRRRLREVVRARLDALPAGARLVVRAQAGAAELDLAALAGCVDAALPRLVGGAR
jgi:ribonuclease P protein component